MLAPEGPAGSEVRIGADGSRAFILRGLRFVDHPDGSIERAREVFQEDDVKALPLPPRLGGGFLFYVTAGGSTAFFRASSWTAKLRPLARVDPPVSSVVAGFDRLYLESATSHVLRAIDPGDGKALDLSPLPAASVYGDMLFADAWHGVVVAGVRGALVTFDAGQTWYPLDVPDSVGELSLAPSGAIVLGTESGSFELDAAGRLAKTSAHGSDALFEGSDTFIRYPREVFVSALPPRVSASSPSYRPLRSAVLRGAADTAETAWVIERGSLLRVRLEDGKVLFSEPYDGREPCRAVPLGAGVGFICGDAHGPTEVYAYREGRLELELSLHEPRAVRSSGNGALVIAAPCAAVTRGEGGHRPGPARMRPRFGALERATVAHYCVFQRSGELFDVRVRGDVGSERVVALRDGRAAVLIPPRSGSAGRLSIVTPSGATGKDLSLLPEAGPSARLVRSGLWLDDLWEVSDGVLGGWVVGARAFVGVHVDLEGVVTIARMQDGVDETSFHGPHALSLAASASVRETSNHGFDWTVTPMPPLLASASGATPQSRPLRGCSSVGCVHDDWVRIGYGEEEVARTERPQPPPRVTHPSLDFAFWTLACDAAPDAASASRASGGGRGRRAGAGRASLPPEVPESSAWLSFQGVPPPRPGGDDVAYDFGETNEYSAYRAYAWGPAAGDWSRHGVWQLRVGDRFSAAPPWSTQVTRSPFRDAATAAQAFGLDPSTGVDFWLRLGAAGESGVLQIRVRSESSVHLIDRERSIVTLTPGSSHDLGTISGAYQIQDQWYIGAARAEQFQLYRVERGSPVLVATYPLWGRIVTQLVRSVHGDELGLLQKSSGSGWYLFPLDLGTFEPAPALFVPAAKLGAVPPVCEPGRPGWLAVSGVPLTESGVSESNTHLDFSGAAEGLRTKRLTARVIIDAAGVCVDALAALSDGQLPAAAGMPRRAGRQRGVPLTVTDPTTDARSSFECTP